MALKVKVINWLSKSDLISRSTLFNKIAKKITPSNNIKIYNDFQANKFVAPGSSRIEFRKAHNRPLDMAPIPRFDADGFSKNLQDITLTTKDYRSLNDRLADAIGTFIWKPEWLSLFVNDPRVPGAPAMVQGSILPPIPVKEMGLDRHGSFLDISTSKMRLIYISDSRFERWDRFFYINVPKEIDMNEMYVSNAREEGIDTRPLVHASIVAHKNNEHFPISIVISPIIGRPDRLLGVYAAGFPELSIFDLPEHTNNQELGYGKLKYFYLLSDAASLVIDDLIKKGIFPH